MGIGMTGAAATTVPPLQRVAEGLPARISHLKQLEAESIYICLSNHTAMASKLADTRGGFSDGLGAACGDRVGVGAGGVLGDQPGTADATAGFREEERSVAPVAGVTDRD